MAKYVTRTFKTNSITCSAPGFNAANLSTVASPELAASMYAQLNSIDPADVTVAVTETTELRRMTTETFLANSELVTGEDDN